MRKARATPARRAVRSGTKEPPEQDAYDVAVRFLGNRPRSVSEIERHLRGKRYEPEAIERAIDQLRAQRYVDDVAFARYWVEQRARFRPKGDRALVSELLAKGVARDTINLAVGERDPDAELAQAREAIRKPITRWASLSERDRKRKIQQYLVARGFSYDTIEAVIARPHQETAE